MSDVNFMDRDYLKNNVFYQDEIKREFSEHELIRILKYLVDAKIPFQSKCDVRLLIDKVMYLQEENKQLKELIK